MSGIAINAPPLATPPLRPGDPAPWFLAPSPANACFSFATLGGRRILLAFVRSLSSQEGRTIAQAYWNATRDAPPNVTAVVIVTADPADAGVSPPQGVSASAILFDFERKAAALFGAGDGPTTFLIDARLIIFGIVSLPDAEAHAAAAIDMFGRAGPFPAASAGAWQAPVLLIPNVFGERLCEKLIEGCRAGEAASSGYMVERDGVTVSEHDLAHKSRSDWPIREEALTAACRLQLQRRIAPEIARAFQFQVSRVERFIVACYDVEARGHFAPHRDNTTKGTAHRRFAVSVNLNTDYDGGEIVFPEYGRARFRPPAGGACVFSCSLMHLVRPVTRGRRYVFVPFLYDEAAKAVRDENLKYVSATSNPKP